MDRGEAAAGYSGGVPYEFIDVTDKEDDPKLILRDGFVPALVATPVPGKVAVLSDAGAETLRSSGFEVDDPSPSSSVELAVRGGWPTPSPDP